MRCVPGALGRVLDVPMYNWLRLAQAYACLNVIDWYDSSPVLVLLNFQNGLSRTLDRTVAATVYGI